MDSQASDKSPTEHPTGGIKRKRVSKACHSCRLMKSKCDGKRPECSRCIDYGYSCVYRPGKRDRLHKSATAEACAGKDTVQGQCDLRKAIRQYEPLLESILSELPSPKQREDANAVLAHLKAADQALSLARRGLPFVNPQTTPTVCDVSHTKQPLLQAERFLGEISDVRFFNLVKQVIQNQLGSAESDQSVDSYEQDGDISSPVATSNSIIGLPAPERLDTYTEVYFSTVHLAFPFIPQVPFMRSLDQVRSLSGNGTWDSTKLALIYIICAIGAYYTSLPGKPAEQEDKSHQLYYLQALSLSLPSEVGQSLDHVCLLLAQCFYLLAVCRTDSCWIKLGQTVRMAQSLGLHIEPEDGKITVGKRLLVERRRRVWSCIYVLDRLVSLQLGRPPAIHEDYYHVPLPSRLGDSDIDWDGNDLPEEYTGPSTGDYHIALISFSDIISQVLRDQCSAKETHDLPGELLKTEELDRQLSQWKQSLPRTLRFDLGHAFERSFVFKRQRSMFAIKYHHLRALIHRPYLCYPVLRNLDDNTEATFARINWPLVNTYERVCISEARETAKLLHCISSEKDLVQDFPWWQMISCLILAGSILVVSSVFTPHLENSTDGLDPASTCDDAETCLRVFEALGANSTGARIARKMMERLKEYGQRWRTAVATAAPQYETSDVCEGRTNISEGSLPSYSPDFSAGISSVVEHYNSVSTLLAPTPSAWPPEIVDSMAWSVQFFGAVPAKEQL